jgi:DNA-binding transcriptional LysR family regulator
MNDLDLNDVRTFVAVAQAGTLTAAAKEMRLPTSTVSRALTRLEKYLGVLLVQRSPRGLVLTDSGKDYLHRADARCKTSGTAEIFWKNVAPDQADSLRWPVPSPWPATLLRLC